MQTVLDVETTFQVDEKGTNPSPFHPENRLVSVGYGIKDNEMNYLCFNHKDNPPTENAKEILQALLNNTTLLIGQNIKFDLQWLRECGFIYDGDLWDTMIFDYIKHLGLRVPLDLTSICKRYGIEGKKSDIVDEYIDNGIDFYSIPWNIVEEYGRNDVEITKLLFLEQQKTEYSAPLIQMVNRFCNVLCEMERKGLKIDQPALLELESATLLEKNQLERELNILASRAMGDTPINLNSPEQLSQLIYSRKVIDKKKWKDVFNIGTEVKGASKHKKKVLFYKSAQYNKICNLLTEPIYKTSQLLCPSCRGSGKIKKCKKDGNFYKKETICSLCKGYGVVYRDTEEVAGFQVPHKNKDAASGGWKTDAKTVEGLVKYVKGDARSFIEKMVRYNALDHYITTFIGGIKSAIKIDGIVHTQYMQCVTATGRISSRNPNITNIPRPDTFPIRKCIVSRFDKGSICEGDYAQLEFRTAVQLAGDKQGAEDIRNGLDVHQRTADTITAAGQTIDRQTAKGHTFKPLYGGMSGTRAEKEYYGEFLDRYKEIAKRQEYWVYCALKQGYVDGPTGRRWHFNNLKMMSNGYVQGSTQVKNYPVQGFATADIVPIACIKYMSMLQTHKMKSLFIHENHDSLITDVFPGEEDEIVLIKRYAMCDVVNYLKNEFGYEFTIPLDVEIKLGKNLMDMEVV